jgi:hypothetical protein
MAMRLVKALRSGKYKQGKHALHNIRTNRYCCLGVACEISGVVKVRQHCGVYACYGQGKETAVLPQDVLKKFGFYSESGRRRDGKWLNIDGKDYADLSHANDLGVPFSSIANYIENNYKDL